MTNVVPLRGELLPAEAQREPCTDVIELLEDLLARAKTGQVRAVALVFLKAPDILATRWADGDVSGHQLVAGVSYLQHRIVHACFDEAPIDGADGEAS